MLKSLLVASILLSCVACESISDDDLPDGAIQTGDDMYMVPVGTPDSNGCQLYRAHSPGKMVPQVIFYRRADGTFVVNKAEAACMSS